MEWLQALGKKCSILDCANFFILTIFIIIYIIIFNNTPWRWTLFVYYMVLILYLLLMIRMRSLDLKHNYKALLMFVNPVIFLFSIFESFFMVLPYFNNNRYDALLEKADFFILGVSPTLWVEQFISPMLTDILYLFYFFYFPMPLILLGWMLKNKNFKEIEKAMFIFLFCYYGAYLIYFIVPAHGPRFFLSDSYTIPLQGYFLAGPIQAIIDTLEPNKLDAFPSLHTAILMVTMAVSYLYNRKIFIWFLPVTVGILISLLYCRYHYFIDIVAGFIWAIFALIIASFIYRKNATYFVGHFGISQE